MQIPTYTQQTSVGGGAPMPRAEATPISNAIGQGLSNLGQGAAGLEQGIASADVHQQRMLREQEEQDGKAWAGQAASNAYVQWQQTMRERQDAATGPAAGFTPSFLKDFDTYTQEQIANAPTEQSKRFLQQHLISLRTQLGGEAIKFEANARLNDRVKSVATSIDNWSNVVYSDPSKATLALKSIDETMPEVGPEAREKLMNKARENIPYYAMSGSLERAAQVSDLNGVRSVMSTLQGPDGDNMDPAKRASLITRAMGYENGILAQNERDADKAAREQLARENAATAAYNSAFDLMSKGRYFSPSYIAELATAAAGTQMEKPVQELLKAQKDIAGFASMSLPQQAAVLERGNAAGSDPGTGVNPTEQKVQEQYKHIFEESQRAYKENPWAAAQERGVIQDAPVMNVSTVQDAQQLMKNRMGQIGVIEVAAGNKVSPLQPAEAEQIGKLVRALPPDQQGAALASFGATVQDPDRLAALAKQFGDKDNILGVAMSYANAKTTLGRYTSELILRGERAIKDNAITIDTHKETGWKGEIAKTIGDAIPDQNLDRAAKQAAYLILAGMESGGDSADVKRAVGMAIGNIMDQRDGSKVPLPYGMKEGTFKDRIKAISGADLAAQGAGENVFVGKQAVPTATFIKQLPDASLMHAGQGRYAVKAGSGLVTLSPGGRPLIIRVPQ
ncbi:hypothetical protein [Ralstonia sp. CP]